jgi:hypothetical protein
MNANEARQRSLENAKNQLDKIKTQIEEAVSKGETRINFIGKLLDGSELWLNENGYKIGLSYNQGTSNEYRDISW